MVQKGQNYSPAGLLAKCSSFLIGLNSFLGNEQNREKPLKYCLLFAFKDWLSNHIYSIHSFCLRHSQYCIKSKMTNIDLLHLNYIVVELHNTIPLKFLNFLGSSYFHAKQELSQICNCSIEENDDIYLITETERKIIRFSLFKFTC